MCICIWMYVHSKICSFKGSSRFAGVFPFSLFLAHLPVARESGSYLLEQNTKSFFPEKYNKLHFLSATVVFHVESFFSFRYFCCYCCCCGVLRKKNWNPNKDITQLLKLIFSLLIVAWEKKTIKKIKCMISSRNSWTYFSYIKKTRIDQLRECAGW